MDTNVLPNKVNGGFLEMNRNYLLCILLFFLLSGCISSLHPLFTNNDLILEQSLIGEWQAGNTNTIWSIFSSSKDKVYRLIVKEANHEPKELELRLGKISNVFFIDISPQEANEGGIRLDPYWIPVHTFARIDFKQEDIILSELNLGVLELLIRKNKTNIKHERLNSGLIFLTASTKELQNFLSRNINNKKLFARSILLYRKYNGVRH
jgi:hypothetical protein